jgi:hypothetical protein
MKPAAREIFGIAMWRGFWLRYFLGGAAFLAVHAVGQTVCVNAMEHRACTESEAREMQDKICHDEPAPANLFIAKPVKLQGVLLYDVGAIVDFDHVEPGTITKIQIRDAKNGDVIFESPLMEGAKFQFEAVPAGAFRLVAVWTKGDKVRRLPLAEQPKPMRCTEEIECHVNAVIHIHGTDNPIDSCPPK